MARCMALGTRKGSTHRHGGPTLPSCALGTAGDKTPVLSRG